MFALLVVAILACTAAKSLRVSDDGLLVQTSVGAIQGHINEVGVREFKGIPYALPPVGDLRWEYPQPAKPFTGTYEANYNAHGCPQLCNLPPGNCPAYGQSEDCLYLAIFAPPSSVPKPENGKIPAFLPIKKMFGRDSVLSSYFSSSGLALFLTSDDFSSPSRIPGFLLDPRRSL